MEVTTARVTFSQLGCYGAAYLRDQGFDADTQAYVRAAMSAPDGAYVERALEIVEQTAREIAQAYAVNMRIAQGH